MCAVHTVPPDDFPRTPSQIATPEVDHVLLKEGDLAVVHLSRGPLASHHREY